MKIHVIETGYFKLDGGAMHGVVPKSMWNKVNTADENNMCTWAMRCLLIVEGNKRILIDTGMGSKQDEKFFSFYYPHGNASLEKSLNALGVDNNDITDVFLTHLHFDHCGGAVKRNGEKLIPTFEKAQYWSHEDHWKSALQPNAREKASFLKENILPLQEGGVLQFYNEGSKSYFNNILDVFLVHGHTEAMMLPLIHANGRKILFCADLIPSAAHVSLPWVMGYDMRPLQTLEEKEKYLQQAVQENWLLYFEHDPKTVCASLIQTEKGVKLGETFDTLPI